jgi:hypothetical protein
MRKIYFVLAALLGSAFAFSQGTLTGTVLDGDTGDPLPGASVVVVGTTTGVATNFDGNFSIGVSSNSGTLVISYVGYTTRNVDYSKVGNLGTISLQSDSQELEGVVLISSVAVDRQTPVAVSTVKAADIELKLGTQEFPEILKSTPGVYATKSGGGFGDGRINLRGFNSVNVAVMINGVPVNDMENGRVYWSNWAGLADVTSSMQVQRGLGASKVAVPSVGGTINILTKTTDVEKGGNVYTGVGNDGYQKYGFTLSTGLMDNGFAATVSASKTKGNGYVDGTEFEGYNYFVNISKRINDHHTISLSSFGAPQRHGQRQNRSSIAKYRDAESGIKFNPDWGIKNGQVVNIEDNFYFKPQTSLNHYWNINDKSFLSTAVYASSGSGGGGGTAGDYSLFNVRLGGDDQPVDLDNIVSINRDRGAQGLEAAAYLRASRNDHEWYGLLSTYKNDLTDNLALLAGVDLRTYTGKHFSELTDLLGGAYVIDNSDVNNPNRTIKVGDKRDYHDEGKVGWQGLFTQLEYTKNKLSAFVAANFANTSYRRIDYFLYLNSDPLQETNRYNFPSYGLKGGANYNLDANNNVFINIGYLERAPGFDAVFLNFDNEHINADAVNEKIFSTEIGYGYRSTVLSANVNIYRTAWNDRTFTDNFSVAGVDYFVNLLGVNALHQGIEVDFVYRPMNKLSLTGMLSLGNWKWTNNVENAQVYDNANQPVGNPINIYIDGLKVGDAAQTTMALGLNYEFFDRTRLLLDYNYYDNYYADFEPTGRTSQGIPQSWKAPSYGLLDAGISHGFDMGGFDATIIARMNNVFNTEYIADALDGGNHDALTALVWYGFGRTFSLGAKIRF